jgi:hypothetical protein
MLIAGDIRTHSFIEHTGLSSIPFNKVEYKKAISKKYNIPLAEIKTFHIDDTSIDAHRIMNTDEFILLWNIDEIIGVSFAPEDNMQYIIAISDKAKIKNNGIDKATINFKILKSDGITVENTFNATRFVECENPVYKFLYKLVFVNGVCLKEFTTTFAGKWIFPSSDTRKINGFRSKVKEIINVFMD